jgi:hypothetical protein
MRILLTVLVLALATPAHAGTIDLSPLVGFLGPYANAVAEALITALMGWVLWIIKTKLSVSIDDSMRDAFQTWLKNQAASLIADGQVKFSPNAKVTVNNDALAAAANTLMQFVPDAANRFGLNPQMVRDKIIDAIPHVPAAAAIMAATASASSTGAARG